MQHVGGLRHACAQNIEMLEEGQEEDEGRVAFQHGRVNALSESTLLTAQEMRAGGKTGSN